ncbi:MAG: ATP-dependent helicase [Sedimentisphaerales bacterium]|nr:ATP-dependent helicase [Sedimentisphaerales bacterium]
MSNQDDTKILGQSGRRFQLQARTVGRQIDWARELNPEQLAVVTAPGGPILVVAGAGSGKTRALTYRVAYLIHSGVDPGRIMLVTFTNRAAREMVSRAEALVGRPASSLWAGTFHHIANRLLRQYGSVLGIRPDFTVLDREDAKDLLGRCIHEAGIDVKARRFPQKAVLASIASFVQNSLEPLERIIARRYPMFLQDIDAIEAVLARYANIKMQRQLLDFDDLLAYWLRLLTEHRQIREELAERFLHILVDEYQDTNAIQGAIVDLLAARHRNLTVVGDDAQSIYSFRGADFENILTFKQRYPDAKQFRLETNYRSTPQILALANASIARNTRRLPKYLRAVRSGGLRPAIVTVYDHLVQSQFIAEYVLHLADQGRRLSEIAVLYRSHWHSLEIQLEFQRRNIPFQVRGGLRFFEQAHIKDVICFLRILQNRQDELAWLRVLRMIPRVGTATAMRIWEQIGNSDDPVGQLCQTRGQGIVGKACMEVFGRFVDLLDGLRALSSPAGLIEKVCKDFYDDYLVSHYDGAELRREDIRGLTNFATQYSSLDAFLSDVALAGEFSGETVVTGPEEQDFVILSTIHQAKGLEWSVVFIPWLADGRFPTDLALNRLEDLEEERRVFHVAVTRAKDELYLIVPQTYAGGPRAQVMMKPSRFLLELATELGELTEPLHVDQTMTYPWVQDQQTNGQALRTARTPKVLGSDPSPGEEV